MFTFPVQDTLLHHERVIASWFGSMVDTQVTLKTRVCVLHVVRFR